MLISAYSLSLCQKFLDIVMPGIFSGNVFVLVGALPRLCHVSFRLFFKVHITLHFFPLSFQKVICNLYAVIVVRCKILFLFIHTAEATFTIGKFVHFRDSFVDSSHRNLELRVRIVENFRFSTQVNTSVSTLSDQIFLSFGSF